MADITITAANVLASSTGVIRREYSAGATITAGQVVYLNASNQWVLADQNAAVTGNGVNDLVGIALVGASLNQPMSVCTGDLGGFTVGGTLANGTSYYLSDTAGGITATLPTTGDFPRFLGIAKSATQLILNPTASGVVI